MASSLRHLISDAAAAAATSLVHRRIPVTQIRGFSSKVVSSPWLMLQSALKEEDDDDDDMLGPALKVSGGAGMDYFNFYSLAQKKVVSFKKPSDHSPHDLLVGCSQGWLALHSNNSNSNSRGGGGGLSLLNPITGENIKLPAIVGSIPDKVILSCDLHEQECCAVASLSGPCELAFCIPGRSSKWTAMTTGSMRIPYSDLAYSTAEGLFFGVKNTQIGERGADEHEVLEVWDATDPSSPKLMLSDHLYGYRYPLGRPETPWHCNTVSYLVYDPDKLLLVRRYVCDKYHNTYGFDVYAVDRERRELVLMDEDCSSLDGLALFVGPSHSLSVRGAAGLRSGSIYYTGSLLDVTWPDRVDQAGLYAHYEDPGVFDYNNIYGGNDIGVFDCKEKGKHRAIDNCYYMHDQH